MMNQIRKMIREKGQGLTEYVLIIAFIAGVAIAMFGSGGSLKDTLVNTVTETNRKLAELFSDERTYASALRDWGKLSKGDLADISNDDRIKMDQQALANIGSFFLNKSKSDVETILGTKQKDNVLLGHYQEGVSGDSINSIYSTRDNITGTSNMINWMQGDYTSNNSYDNSSRYFFSDYANSHQDGVKVFLTYDSNNTVTTARAVINPGSINDSENHKKLDMTVTSSGEKYATQYH